MITIDKATKELLSDDTISNNTKLALMYIAENKGITRKELRGKMKLKQEDFIKCMDGVVAMGYVRFKDTFGALLLKINNGWDGFIVTSAKYMTIEEYIGEYDYYPYFIRFADKLGIDKRKIVLAKALCAETIIKFTKDKPTIDALRFAKEYGNGKYTDKEFEEYNIGKKEDIKKDKYIAIYKAVRYVFTEARYSDYYPAWYIFEDQDDIKDINATKHEEYYNRKLLEQRKKEIADICREVLGSELIERLNAEMQKAEL